MKSPENTDFIDIIRRAKNGDAEAFGVLYQEYYTPVYRYVYFRCRFGEDAPEDITQDVFLKAYTSFDAYSYTGTSPLAYLYTIAKNLLIDRGRKKRIPLVHIDEDDDVLEQIPDGEENANEQMMRREEAQALRDKIQLLSPDQHDVILLRFIDGLSTKEVADALGKNEPAVRKLQSKGLRSLREILNTHEHTPTKNNI